MKFVYLIRTPTVKLFRAAAARLIGALFLMAAVSAFAQGRQDFSKVEIKDTQVAGQVHLLEGAGGNIGVLTGTDGILIVDDEFLPLAEKIDAALSKLNSGKLEYVINTHVHGDHVGGNAYFGKRQRLLPRKICSRLAADECHDGGAPGNYVHPRYLALF